MNSSRQSCVRKRKSAAEFIDDSSDDEEEVCAISTSWTLHIVEEEMWIGRDVTTVICGITESVSVTMVD